MRKSDQPERKSVRGAKFEVLKVLRGDRDEKEIPLPSRLGNLRQRHKLPRGDDRGGAPADRPRDTDHFVTRNVLFLMILSHKTALKSGISRIPRETAGIRRERGKIPPKVESLACLG